VYLLHFASPIGELSNPRGAAQHYMGFAERSRLVNRLGEHAAATGKGARLVQVVLEAGCAVELVRVWPGGSRWLERSLKNRHGTTVCPRCPSPPSRRLPRSRRPAQPRLFDPGPYQWPPPREGVGW
jgi:putative endonuclease